MDGWIGRQAGRTCIWLSVLWLVSVINAINSIIIESCNAQMQNGAHFKHHNQSTDNDNDDNRATSIMMIILMSMMMMSMMLHMFASPSCVCRACQCTYLSCQIATKVLRQNHAPCCMPHAAFSMQPHSTPHNLATFSLNMPKVKFAIP